MPSHAGPHLIRPAAATEARAGYLLPRGSFFGRIPRRLSVSNAVLAEVHHERPRVLPPHVHAGSFFCVMLDGEYQDTVGRQTRDMRPLEATYAPPGMEHSCRVGRSGARFFTLTIDAGFLAAFGQQLDTWRSARTWDSGQITPQLLRLFAVFALAPETLDALTFEDQLSGIVQGVARVESPGERRRPCWVDVSRARLTDSLPDSPGVVELARDAGVHPVHFSRTFRRFVGCGPAEYRARARVVAACRFLAASDQPLAQIAARIGFADQSHMTRAFRRVIRVTPAIYRRMIRGRARRRPADAGEPAPTPN